jgi:hypothetical protein
MFVGAQTVLRRWRSRLLDENGWAEELLRAVETVAGSGKLMLAHSSRP